MPCLCLTKACFSLLLSLSLNTFQLIPTLCSVFPFQLSAFRPSWVPLWVSPLPVQLGLIPLCLPVSQSCDGPCLSRLLQYGEHCQLTQECKQWTRSVFVPTAMRPCTRLLALIQSWVKMQQGIPDDHSLSGSGDLEAFPGQIRYIISTGIFFQWKVPEKWWWSCEVIYWDNVVLWDGAWLLLTAVFC